MERNKTFVLLVIFSITCWLRPGEVSCAYEDVSMGAQPAAMGGAFTANRGSIYSLFYNPAGLAYLSRFQLAAEFSSLLQGLDDNSTISNGNFVAGFPLNADVVALGISYAYLSLSQAYSEDIVRFSVGWKPKDLFSVGIALKMMSQKYIVADNPY